MTASNSPNTSFEQLPEELRTLAELGLSNARRELEQTGKLNPEYWLRQPDGGIEWVQLTDDMAELFFGTGPRRNVFFDVLRAEVETAGITAVILVSDMFMGKTTEKFLALPPEEIRAIIDAGHNMETMEKRGWVTKQEAILVSVQTPEKAAMVTQEYERDRLARRIVWGRRTARCGSPDSLDDRIRMFGKQKEG
jgi:hypothetical protein